MDNSVSLGVNITKKYPSSLRPNLFCSSTSTGPYEDVFCMLFSYLTNLSTNPQIKYPVTKENETFLTRPFQVSDV